MTQFNPKERIPFNPNQTGLGGIFGLGGGPKGLWPHIQPQPINQDPWGIKPMGEQITGFEEQLGGYGEQLSGLGDRFGQQLSGLGDRFGGVNDKLSKIEEGIGSLLQNRGSGRGMNMQPNYGYSPYNMLLNSFFGGYR
jgi:hypothetical protein